jgi:DNA-binding MarR family transcriptional regulator
MIDRLVGEGLVERLSCPKDRRGHLLVLTARGKVVRLAAWSVYAPAMAEAMAGVSEEEALKLAELIDRLAGVRAAPPIAATEPEGEDGC